VFLFRYRSMSPEMMGKRMDMMGNALRLRKVQVD